MLPAIARKHRAVAGSLLFLWLSGPTWADPCAELPKPSITVERLEAQVSLNTRYSFKTLNNLGAEIGRPGHQVLGLTRGTASASLASQTPGLADPSGRWECASPQITLRYGYQPITVYVASEFPPGTCAYQQIYEHEMRHVKIYQDHLASIEPTLRAALEERFANGGLWRGAAGEVGPRLQRELQQRWLPMIRREIRRVEAAQALIDTDDEYRRVAESCGGQIRKLMR
jgi:hypothetical protein